MKQPKSVWILEDDPGLCFIYREILETRYALDFHNSLASFIRESHEKSADLLIADLRLTDGNFLDFLKKRTSSKNAFKWEFIVVSSIDDLDVLRACFEHGASDYLTKPFTRNELIVKTERIFERLEKRTLLFKIDTVRSKLKGPNDVEIQLTAKELQIFIILFDSGGRPVLRNKILKDIWGDINVTPKTLDVHLFHLRKKLSPLFLEIHYHGKEGYSLSGDGVGNPIST